MMDRPKEDSQGLGSRSPDPRREDVPGVLPSSSSDGSSAALPACVSGDNVSAVLERGTGAVGWETSSRPEGRELGEPSTSRNTVPAKEDPETPLPQRKKKKYRSLSQEAEEMQRQAMAEDGCSQEEIDREIRRTKAVLATVEIRDPNSKERFVPRRRISDEDFEEQKEILAALGFDREAIDEELDFAKHRAIREQREAEALAKTPIEEEESDCSFSSLSKRRKVKREHPEKASRTSAEVTGDPIGEVEVKVDLRAGSNFSSSPVLGTRVLGKPITIDSDDDDEFTSDKEDQVIKNLIEKQRQLAMDAVVRKVKERKQKKAISMDKSKMKAIWGIDEGDKMETDTPPPTVSSPPRETHDSEPEVADYRKFGSVKVEELGDRVIRWLKEIDTLRAKSRNLQGGVSGTIKRNMVQAITAVQDIVMRVDSYGDSAYLRSMNAEVSAELRRTEKERDLLKNEVELLKKEKAEIIRSKEILALEKESLIREMKEKSRDYVDWKVPYPVPSTSAVNSQIGDTEMSDASTDTNRTQSVRKNNAKRGPSVKRRVYNEREERAISEANQLDVELTRRIDTFIQMRKTVRQEKQSLISGLDTGNKEVISRKDRQEQLKDEAWNLVVSKRQRRKKPEEEKIVQKTKPTQRGRPDVSKPTNRKIPKTAAVTIKVDTQVNSYADIIRKARDSVSLSELGIQDTKLRKARGGALVIEVPGERAQEQADLLADRLSNALGGNAVVSRPSIKGELRIIGIEDSVTVPDIKTKLALLTDGISCDFECSPISTMRNGMGIAWVKCKLDVAVKLASMDKIQLGWSVVRVELLKARPLQCYRCWSIGHVKSECKSEIDRSTTCYKCSQEGHLAKTCDRLPNCAVCQHAGVDSAHRMGGAQCKIRNLKKILENRRRNLIEGVLKKDREKDARKEKPVGRNEVAGSGITCDSGELDGLLRDAGIPPLSL